MHYKRQPKLEEAAEHVHISASHFQRMFQQWAGVTPKQFVQFLSLERAKGLLKNTGATLFDTAYETGLSGTGRLHDLFIKLEGMTPGEYKNGGQSLQINYHFAASPFGELIVASTEKGICHLTFSDEGRGESLRKLKLLFPNAVYKEGLNTMHERALKVFNQDWSKPGEITLRLKGSPFQIKVWQTLLAIPAGALTTYGALATKAGYGRASRAVGTAIANNPIAFLIPCHRVIRSTGEIGQYHWGPMRKNAMIGWEAARNSLVR